MGMIRDAIERKGLTINAVSRICEVSELLIRMLDAGHVTHPRIAHRVANLLELTPEQEEALKPEEYRGKPVPEKAKPVEVHVTPPAPPKKKHTQGTPVVYNIKDSVMLRTEKIWELLDKRKRTCREISLKTDHSAPWMSSCMKTARMRKKDVIIVARMLGVDPRDIIYKEREK